uniref:Uncharacterized protein n=1 Tax=Avena sativa TaxID=4498 RepID=A0ACD5VXZ1_AVESA
MMQLRRPFDLSAVGSLLITLSGSVPATVRVTGRWYRSAMEKELLALIAFPVILLRHEDILLYKKKNHPREHIRVSLHTTRETMPKRKKALDADGLVGGRTVKRRHRHLYLVMDDWESGYTIRKVDLSSESSSDSDDSDDGLSDAHVINNKTEQPEPPAVIRLEATHSRCDFFAAIGTKIMVTNPVITSPLERERNHVFPVFDVHTRVLSFGPQPKTVPSAPIYFPVIDKIFCLDDGRSEILFLPPRDEVEPGKWLWSWSELPKPPFRRFRVTSHAVHPDGRTIFVSVKRRATAATFTFDTGLPDYVEWKRHGEWILPFSGRAYFDRELDAWVGLSGDPDALGHLCSCTVPPIDAADGAGNMQSPAWKVSKEKVFCEDSSSETHMGATLVYMGGRSQFCLVQCLSIDESCDADYKLEEEEDGPQPCRNVLRLTTFSLKYDKNGDLRTTSRRVRSYKFATAKSYYSFLANPVAFWM